MAVLTPFNFAFAAWSVASALAVGALGAFSLSGGRSRPRGALAFGLFALFWALHIIAGAFVSIAVTPETARVLGLAFLVTLLPLPYFLVEVVLAHAPPERRSLHALRWTAAGVAFLSATLLLAEPRTMFEGVRPLAGGYYPDWGPFYVPLAQVPLFLAFGASVFILNRLKDRAATARIARRLATLVGGIGLYAGFAAANNLTFFLGGDGGGVDRALYLALFATVSAVLAYVGFANLRSSRHRPGTDEARRDRAVAIALLAPLVLGALEGWVAVQWFTFLNTVGLWRLAGVAVIAYGIARWRIYDLPQRVASGAATTGGAVAAVAGGATTYGLASLAFTGVGLPAAAAVAVTGAALLPSIRFVKRFVAGIQSSSEDAEEKLYGQRIETYRAAVESSLARGTLEEDEEFLAALRHRFRITADEDRVLRYYARSAVLVPRDAGTGAYERLRLLGEGGSGRTWLARDRTRDRLVVLKEPLERWQREPALRDAVLREARLAARVRHPNVVAIEEIVEQDGHPVIVMEFMDGGALADVLAARGTLPWKEATSLVVDVLRGLEAVHQAGIVHRDVKPSNVLLTAEGVPKIGDFGVALVPSSRKTVIDLQGPVGGRSAAAAEGDTLNTVRAGTPLYMPPEVRSGASLGDRRADVYACAAVLHECLYGTPPAPGAAVVVRNDVPPALAAALARGLAEKPDQRWPSARAFADELVKVMRS